MTNILPDRWEQVKTLPLARGSHSPDSGEMCALEMASFVAGEPHTDHPKCVSPVIAAFCRRWNDDLGDAERQWLKPYIPRLVGTNAGLADDERRMWMVTDWMVREYLPAWLKLAGLTPEADVVANLPALTDAESWRTAKPKVQEARSKAAAAGAAVRAAAGAAARAAAGDAAGAAAGAAAGDAAGAAAGDAVRAAVGAAVGDAAWDAVRAAVGDAAWDAVRAAVGAAAGDAAGDAAGAAAWDAVRDAVRAAAGAAAGDAAWDAVGDAVWDAVRAAVRAAAGAAAGEKLAPIVADLQQSALRLLDRLIAVGRVESTKPGGE